VLGGKHKPHRVTVPLADIAEAVVQVEFSPPGPRELELAGGVAPGRPKPGHDDEFAVDLTAAARATPASSTESAPASDSPTEGIVE
jgi:ribosome maturation factor RimP